MVCDKCEKKLNKSVNPDTWKEGARNTTGGKDGGRKVGANMLLYKKSKPGFTPLGGGKNTCKTCKKQIEKEHKYC